MFSTFNIPTPACLLTGAVRSLFRSVTQRCSLLNDRDIVLQIPWTHLHDAQATDSLERSLWTSSEAMPEKCSLCSFHTTNVAHFRRHCTMTHGLWMARSQFGHFWEHTDTGLPQCKFCGSVFATWSGFKTHVERGCQSILRGPQPCLLPEEQPRRDCLGTINMHMQITADAAVRSVADGCGTGKSSRS